MRFTIARRTLVALVALIAVDAAVDPRLWKPHGYPARPLSAVVGKLVQSYGYVITYEDPRYEYPLDRPDGLPLSVPPVANSEEMATALNQLVNSRLALGGHFKVLRTPGVFHVVPTEKRDSKSRWIADPSILDAPISIPLADRTEHEMLEAVCAAVGSANRVRVEAADQLDEGIQTTLEPVRYRLGADNEVARSVVLRVLSVAKRPEKLTWQLLYDPELGEYLLNIEGVPDLSSKPAADTEKNQRGPRCVSDSSPPSSACSRASVQATRRRRASI